AGSSEPGADRSAVDPRNERLAQWFADHLGNSLLFATIGMMAASRRNGFGSRWPILSAACVGFCVAAGIEFAQIFARGRYSETLDVILGTLSAALGGILTRWVSSDSNMARSPGNSSSPRAGRWFALSSVYTIALLVVFTAP